MQTNLTAGMSDFDTRRFKLRPWYGDQGEYFVRVFVPEVEGYFHSRGDQDSSWHDTAVTQLDMGGVHGPNFPQIPNPAGGANIDDPVFVGRRTTRLREIFGFVRHHCQAPSIQQEMDRHAAGNGLQAWRIAKLAGTPPRNMLNLTEQDQEWDGATIMLVGCHERSIECLYVHLVSGLGTWPRWTLDSLQTRFERSLGVDRARS